MYAYMRVRNVETGKIYQGKFDLGLEEEEDVGKVYITENYNSIAPQVLETYKNVESYGGLEERFKEEYRILLQVKPIKEEIEEITEGMKRVCGISISNTPPQIGEYTALIKFLERKARLLKRKRDLVRSEIKKQIRGSK